MFTPRMTVMGTAALLAMALACSRQSAAPTSPTALSTGDPAAAADGSTLKATTTPVSPTNDQALTNAPTLTTSAATMKFGGTPPGPLSYRFQVFNEIGAQIQDSGPVSTPSFTVTASMDFKKRHTWRVRPEFQGAAGPWSAAASFVSPEGGYIRGNEVFDPLYNGITFGERIGPTTFVPDKGIRLDTSQGYVRYTIPTLSAGEFSMEVEGLRANAPGDKSKVFAMSTNGPDFITDRYRVDIQYRGTTGAPPNAITYRVIFGDADDLDVRYEPDQLTRISSVRILDPAKTYFWKYTWGSGEVRVTLQEGGAKANGPFLYNHGIRTFDGSYNPSPHYLYLGAPTGRSGAEAASIPQTIYRNVWIGARPRP